MSNVITYMNATGVSVQDFNLGFRIGTAVCDRHAIRELRETFRGSVAVDARIAQGVCRREGLLVQFGRRFSELLSPLL